MAKSTDADDIHSAEPETDAETEVETDGEADAEAETETEVQDEDEEEEDDALPARSESTDELWEELGVDPVKIALPRDLVGYTLRAYRPQSQLTPTEVVAADRDEDEDDPFAARERARAAEDAAFAEELGDADAPEEDDALREDEEPEDRAVEEEEPDDAEPEPVDEEVPVFLSHRGKLLLFGTPEALVSFVGSDASHDLVQLDTWTTLAKRVRPEDIVPIEEDVYELDLVVENLRGGHDSWNLSLLIGAGELARDLGYALRLEPVVTALTPGSPLDDLDEACRAAAGGGIGGMLARRRLRRVGAQQASLGWRTVIGKISDAVDWRD